MDENATPLDARGTVCSLYDLDGSKVAIACDERDGIIAALRKYVQSGSTVDTLLEITTEAGALYVTRASRIASLYVTTADERARITANAKRNYDECVEHRAQAGFHEPLAESDW